MRKLFISKDIPKSLENLLVKENFSVIKLNKEKDLPPPVSSHADMLIFSDGDRLVTTKKYYNENKTCFYGSEIITTNDGFGSSYPKDIIFNAFVIEDTLFGKTDSISREITALYKKKQNLSQGYAKCSTLLFGNNAVTADTGIYNALYSHGINALLIKAGGIRLPGYNYGFIGGASFVFDDTVMFFGNLCLHPDYKEITDFIYSKGYKIISDNSMPLTDFGGAVIDKSRSL